MAKKRPCFARDRGCFLISIRAIRARARIKARARARLTTINDELMDVWKDFNYFVAAQNFNAQKAGKETYVYYESPDPSRE